MEPEQRDRPQRAAEAQTDEKDKSFSAACLRYLKNRRRGAG